MQVRYFYLITLTLFCKLAFSIENNKCLLENGIIVYGSENKLLICENKQLVYWFHVGLGKEGLGKTQTGDNKTPVGIYSLGKPRKSSRFGIFIPIKYPTISQQSNGYTGSAIGIHGPHPMSRLLGSARNTINWTEGCVALARDRNIKMLSGWVRAHPNAKVLIKA